MRVIKSFSRRFLRRTIAVVLAIALLIICGDKLISYTAKLLYPDDYAEQVQQYSSEYGVDKSLCFALIRCESGFDPTAESSAGACGLMQLTPDTFSWICSKLYDYEVDAELIYDPATNIKCGVWYISYLQGEFEGDREVIAAYNAGPAKVKNWLADARYSSDGKSLASAPYKETQNHIKKVLKTQEIYIKLYGME